MLFIPSLISPEIRAAKRSHETVLAWLLRQFDHLPITEREKANLFDSLGLWIHSDLGNSPATRTKMRVRVNSYHQGPLVRRSKVSLPRWRELRATELGSDDQ